MKLLKRVLTFALILIPVLTSGQDQKINSINKGLTVGIQDNQLGIMIPFYLSTRFVLSPGFQFIYASKAGVDLSIGMSTKSFFKDNDRIRPYWGLKAGLGYFNPKAINSPNQTDFVFGGAIGAEYFFNQNFSIGIEPQLNLTISDDESDRFGNPGGTGINTSTMLTANIYF